MNSKEYREKNPCEHSSVRYAIERVTLMVPVLKGTQHFQPPSTSFVYEPPKVEERPGVRHFYACWRCKEATHQIETFSEDDPKAMSWADLALCAPAYQRAPANPGNPA